MNCREVMREMIWVCAEDESAVKCADAILCKNIHMLMVMDRRQRVAGVLPRETVLSAPGRNPLATAGELMSTDIVYCRPDDDVDEVAKTARQYGATAAFVVDGDRLLGWALSGELNAYSQLRRAASSSHWLVEQRV